MEGGGAFRDGDGVEGVVTVGSSVVIILCVHRVCVSYYVFYVSLSDILRFPGDSCFWARSLTTKLINSTELAACGGFLLSAFRTNTVSGRKCK